MLGYLLLYLGLTCRTQPQPLPLGHHFRELRRAQPLALWVSRDVRLGYVGPLYRSACWMEPLGLVANRAICLYVRMSWLTFPTVQNPGRHPNDTFGVLSRCSNDALRPSGVIHDSRACSATRWLREAPGLCCCIVASGCGGTLTALAAIRAWPTSVGSPEPLPSARGGPKAPMRSPKSLLVGVGCEQAFRWPREFLRQQLECFLAMQCAHRSLHGLLEVGAVRRLDLALQSSLGSRSRGRCGGTPQATVAGGGSGPGGMAVERGLLRPCRIGPVEAEKAPPVGPPRTHPSMVPVTESAAGTAHDAGRTRPTR